MDTPLTSSEQNSSVESTDLSGITISGQANVTARDIIGRDKIIHGDEYIGYTAAQVTVLLDKIRTEYTSKPFDGHSPYIGLASFQERDADKFFGRETLTAELVTRVAASAASSTRAVFVAGPSGSGKSSLVRAGLIPALKYGKVAGSEHWLYETLKPGRAPLDELARVVSSFANSPDAGDDLRAQALDDTTRLHRWADIALKDDAQRRAVIVIDQFEEIFTQLAPERENERVAFLNLLTDGATIENGRVLVIFTLRSDFVTNCASYPNLNALVNQQFIQVGAMTPDELVSAIARPAYQVGLRIDPALISQIVNDVRGEPGALPLMQFALQDLFEHEKYKGELTLDGYLARGGLHEALERHADAEFAKLGAAEKQLARSVFSGLVEIGRGREDTKRTALFGELVPAGADAARVQALVRELADARLLTTDKRGDEIIVTLAHERLIDAWDWLRRLVDENRDAIALQNEIAQDAQEWETQQRDESYLYRGARLATAQEKLQQNKLVLSGLAQEFVETANTAREEVKQREARRTRRLILGFGAAAVVFAVLAVFAFFLWQAGVISERRAVEQKQLADAGATSAVEAQSTAISESNARATSQADASKAEIIAESRRLAAESGLLAQQNLDTALLLGVEAAKLSQNDEVRNNLLATLEGTQLITSNRQNRSPVVSISISPDGNTLASGSWDGMIRLWDVQTEIPIGNPLTGHEGPVSSVAFSPDGKTLASAGADKTIRLWDWKSGNAIRAPFIGHTDWVATIAFSPNGKLLVSGSNDQTVRLWDVASGKAIGPPLSGHTGIVHGVAFSPDGKSLASGSVDRTIRLWNVEDRTQIGEPIEGHTDEVTSVAFSPDGKTLASGSNDQTIQLWDMGNRKQIGELLKGHTNYVASVTFSPDGSILATGGWDRTIRLWDVSSGTQIGPPLNGHTSVVHSLVFSPDGKVLISGSRDETIRLWDLPSAVLYREPIKGHTDSVVSVVFSPNGRTMASASLDRSIRLWDVSRLRQIGKPLMGHTDFVTSVTFSPDGKMLASGSEDRTVRLWDVGDQREVGKFEGHVSAVFAVAYSSDGKYLASGSNDRKIYLWDVNSQKWIGEFIGHISAVTSVVFSPDGNLLATGSADKTIRIWDVAERKLVGEPLSGHTDTVSSVAFSPDGKLLASSSFDHSVRLWDASNGTQVGILYNTPVGFESKVVFSPQSHLLASGGNDRTVRLWDVTRSSEIGNPLSGHTDEIFTLSFSPDGMMLASGSRDRTIRLWNIQLRYLNLEELQEIACRKVNRNLTRSEYERYFNEDRTAYDTEYAKHPTCEELAVEPGTIASPTPTSTPIIEVLPPPTPPRENTTPDFDRLPTPLP